MKRCFALALSLLVPACGDDGLGKTFQPTDQDVDLGDLSPITAGTGLWYAFTASYRPELSGGGGTTANETQSSGNLCIKVDEVQDTAVATWQDEDETRLATRVKVRGSSESAEVVTSYNGAVTDAASVDAKLTTLWLKKLTVPSGNHGFASPAARVFNTRKAPTPPEQNLSRLPFFDVRTAKDGAWQGWNGADPYIATTVNFLNSFYRYFLTAPYDQAFFLDSTRFKKNDKWNPTCDGYADQNACMANSCTWDFMANNSAGACISMHSINVVWRETLAGAPSELGESVVHKLRFEYNAKGILRYAQEFIVPDTGSAVPSDITQCAANGACLTATVELWEPFSAAPCTF